MELKLKELENLVHEHNELLDKLDEKWNEIYEKIEEMNLNTEKYNEIGSMIANSQYEDLDPIQALKINYDLLTKEIQGGK